MNQKYVAPTLSLKSFTCPHCHTLSLMQYDSHRFIADVKTGARGVKSISNNVFIVRCENCGKKIIWIDNNYVYPDIVAEEANPDMPKSVKQLFDEAGLIYNKSRELLVLYCVWQ